LRLVARRTACLSICLSGVGAGRKKGFHTEYASFKFALFFIAEYTSMITVSCLCSIMFFGGWLSPFPASWTFTHYLPSAI